MLKIKSVWNNQKSKVRQILNTLNEIHLQYYESRKFVILYFLLYFPNEFIFTLFFQTSMSANPIPWGVGFVEEPASTPQDPTCVPVRMAGGL